jgi:2-dehydro-3-deoxyphosphooctonate aldolase (KDO 8-P synthase)
MPDVKVNNVNIGSSAPLTIISGPCVAESADLCLNIAEKMHQRCDELGLGYIFKASFDKANRSSVHSPRGPGLDEGLAILEKVKSEISVPVTTDLHESVQAHAVGQVVDVLQIPAFLCRQTDLLIAAAATGKVVNVKKGQFMSPDEMRSVVTKIEQGFELAKIDMATTGIVLTERGTFFGYQRLVNDFVGLGDMMELGWPVCFDVTHSTQLPGGAQASGTRISGGRPDRAPLLARCAAAAGVAALFIETHPQPSEALSDGATMLPLDQALELLEPIARIANL